MTLTRPLAVTLAASLLASPALAFDQATLDATKACHDHIWFQVPAFKDLPNAAISAFPGSLDGDTYEIFWIVKWDAPRVRAAGDCTVIGGKVERFEDYTKQ